MDVAALLVSLVFGGLLVTSWIQLSRLLSERPDVEAMEASVERALEGHKRTFDNQRKQLTAEWDEMYQRLERIIGRATRYRQEDAGRHKGGPNANSGGGAPLLEVPELTRAQILAKGKEQWAASSQVRAAASLEQS